MVLEFKGISKRYGGVIALQNADLVLKGGEIRALLGGNGSGKSTLIKVAAGLVRKDSGEILLDGKKLEITSPKTAKHLKIVATAQELSILPNLSVEENLTLCQMPLQKGIFLDRKEIRTKAKAILAQLGMERDIDTPVAELPINKQYLLEFGKAIFQEFDVLLVDEVTSALYREDVEVVSKILKEFKAQGKMILFVSHRMVELFSICDTVTVMRNGNVISTYELSQTNTDELLADMVGDKDAAKAPPASAAENAPQYDEGNRETLLSVKNLPIKAYQSMLNLEIHKGEIIGVAGLQGHGQSDLVRSLFGLNGPVRVVLNGTETIIDKPRQAVRKRFAYVSGDRERDGSFKEHNLSDNIKTVGELIFHKRMDAQQTLIDLGVKFDTVWQKITSLSGGNQQKVIFGRWIATSPLLLLANDPSKGIDVRARGELRDIIWELSRQGMAVVFVSSDEDELISLCSVKDNARVIVMYEGTIVETLRGAGITRDHLIAATLAKGDQSE